MPEAPSKNRELTSAANALVQWFNSQSISSGDAEQIMMKVQAVLIEKRTRSTINRGHIDLAHEQFKYELDEHMRILAHEIIDRIHAMRKSYK